MSHVRVESIDLDGVIIKTTEIDIFNKEAIDDHISFFLRSAVKNETKVIGFDIQFSLLSNNDSFLGNSLDCKRANLNFCVGHSCLIVRLTSKLSCYNLNSFISLHNFLSLPEYVFVGVGIKDNLAKLEKQYEIGCRNAVELGPMAASLMNMPRLSFCGADEQAFVVNQIDLREHRPLIMDFERGSRPLSIELVKLATVNVYSYYRIGSKLLGAMY
jgi:hypothetical protein